MERHDSRDPDTDIVLAENRTRAPMVGGEHFRKELFEQLINGCSEHLQMSLRQFLKNCAFVEKLLILSE
jgi:hypothetical protein